MLARETQGQCSLIPNAAREPKAGMEVEGVQHCHAIQAVEHANSATRLTPHATHLLLQCTIIRVSYVLGKAGKGWDILEIPQEDATFESLGDLHTTPRLSLACPISTI
jgi:hypothetical protein